MALPEVTYGRYRALGGTCGEEAFAASLRAAVASVRDVIGPNEPRDGADAEAYERAVCAAVDVDRHYGASGGVGEGLSSVTIGKFSASMGGAGGRSPYDADMARVVRLELAGSSLLYQGVRA